VVLVVVLVVRLRHMMVLLRLCIVVREGVLWRLRSLQLGSRRCRKGSRLVY